MLLAQRSDEARAILEQALARNLDNESIRYRLYDVALGTGDAEAHVHAVAAVDLALWGRSHEAESEAKEALALSSQSRGVVGPTLDALALAGANAKLDSAIADAEKRHPLDTRLRERNIPVDRALQETLGGKPDRALEILQPAERFPSFAPLHYTRGLALLGAGRAQEATQEFQKVLGLRYAWPTSPLITLAHLNLARAASAASNSAEARKHYQDFFALVKDPDPDLPVLQQAKAEYAKLK